jgi:adenylylsulfate kinase
MIYWFIGQPGCGKTTLARRLKKHFDANGNPSIHLDGDDLRKIFGNAYAKENFTKEYRTEQTRALQRFVAHVADQGIDVIISTVNPYREVREEFKKSQKKMREIHVSTSDIRGRESFHVKDFEEPVTNYIAIVTGGGLSEEQAFNNLYHYL